MIRYEIRSCNYIYSIILMGNAPGYSSQFFQGLIHLRLSFHYFESFPSTPCFLFISLIGIVPVEPTYVNHLQRLVRIRLKQTASKKPGPLPALTLMRTLPHYINCLEFLRSAAVKIIHIHPYSA